MVVPSPSSTKAQLRASLRSQRRAFANALSPKERHDLEQSLADRLEPVLAGARVIGGYCPIGSEISPLGAMRRAGALGSVLAFPAFDNPYAPFRFRAGVLRAPGLFGIPEPDPDAPVVFPDLVLVPLLAVDGVGTRLGQGSGHYDRVLATLRERGARLIGVGWPLQRLAETLPADPWDVTLDGFASPDKLESLR